MWNRTENQIRNQIENQIIFVLIRHGETKANQEHRYLGRTDEELSKEGKEKLLSFKEKQAYPSVEKVFISPMQRCKQTAELLYPNQEATSILEWVEMDFGAFEGKNYIELKDDVRYQAWIDSNGTLPFPEGESREAFIQRCQNGFEKMLEELMKKNFSKIGAIVHGGTIMALLSTYCGGDYFDYQVANGKGYICTVTNIDAKPCVEILRKIE